MRKRFAVLILGMALFLAFLPGGQAAAGAQVEIMPGPQQSGAAPVITLRFEGALHPVMIEHFKRALSIAEKNNAQAIIVGLDTPGGELGLMEQIEQTLRASPIPVIVYVSPRGAMAGSAGLIVTLSGHLSAMAPETTIGASSPVGPSGEDIGTTMESKVKEIMKATARTLASDRPPEAVKLAEQMIDNARAASVSEAVRVGLVDFQANDINDLLRQADGRQVKIGTGTRTLHTASAPVIEVKQTVGEELLTVLANPNIVFLLLAVGIQAILIEISHPGGWVAGFIGAVCLLLATYGMGLLPVNWFGALFMVLAFVLFLLDIKAPTHGALTAAGVGAFIVGALVLFNSPQVPSFQRVSVPLVVGTGLAIGLIFFTIVGFALRAQRTPLKTGQQNLIGQVGIVNTPLSPVGTVQLGSELWTAVVDNGGASVPRGERVQVIGMERLKIKVRKVEEKN